MQRRASEGSWRTYAVYCLFCVRLTGHFPVCGWICVAAAFVKQRANTGGMMKHKIPCCVECLKKSLRSSQTDPVHCDWGVNGQEVTVWVDASSLATVEYDGAIIEDTSYFGYYGLRPQINSPLWRDRFWAIGGWMGGEGRVSVPVEQGEEHWVRSSNAPLRWGVCSLSAAKWRKEGRLCLYKRRFIHSICSQSRDGI